MRVAEEAVLAGRELQLERLFAYRTDVGRDVDTARAGEVEVVVRGLVVDDERVAAGGQAVGAVEADVEARADAPSQRRAVTGGTRPSPENGSRGCGRGSSHA